jgi:ABC-2 type transport system permease protein
MTATLQPTRRAPRPRSTVRRLVTAELRMVVRDPLTLTFVLAFPIVTMLVIGGSFSSDDRDGFGGVEPSQWYVASYFTVVLAATGLIMLPVHIASYRERGVLRRFAAAGFPRWSFALSQLVVGLATVVVAALLLLAVATPVYGVPSVHDAGRTVAGVVVGSLAFVSLGVLLGTVLPSARSAQAVGLLLFFPSFLLGGGGPPPSVMTPVLQDISQVLPLTLVTQAIRDPWLGLGHATGSLLAVTVIAAVGLVLSARRTAL